MKKYAYLIMLLVAVSLLVGVQFAGASKGTNTDQSPPDPVRDPLPADWPKEPGAMPALIGGKKADRPMVLVDEADVPQDKNSTTATTINVWHADPQSFGAKGNPQQWINILGNVSYTVAIKSLTYSLNGGPEKDLTLGPGNPPNRRLINLGDFNIEIDHNDPALVNGANSVEIKATDIADSVTTKTVTVNYTKGTSWPKNYEADWSSSSNIQDIAQVVDGHWKIAGGKLVPNSNNDIGYNRWVAIGDITGWTDYEVTVPVTVNALDADGFTGPGDGPAVGVMLRWQGHSLNSSEQPRVSWPRYGALGWYRWKELGGEEGLELRGHEWYQGTSTAKVWEFGVPYMIKMSVRTPADAADTRAYYRLKFWKQGTAEPFFWDLEGYSEDNNSPSGSLVLIANYVDVEFGNPVIESISDKEFNLQTSVTGAGSIYANKPDGKYPYGTFIRLDAVQAQNSKLSGWSGSVSQPGTVDPLSFSLTQDTQITANFVPASPGKLDVTVVGKGEVIKTPDEAQYFGGKVVTVTAVNEPGYIFKGWSGDLTGTLNPATIQIDGDKAITATFEKLSDSTPLSDEFNRCELNTQTWSFINPTGEASVKVIDGAVELSLPAGNPHWMWDERREAPRIMQATENQDFDVIIKFNTVPQDVSRIEGFLVEQDDENWLRFDIHNTGTTVAMFAGGELGGTALVKHNIYIGANQASEIYMRVSRVGNSWTQSYSLNGTSWLDPNNFNATLAVKSTGIYVANPADPGAAPAYKVVADFFRNAAFPAGDTGYKLVTTVNGEGAVEVTPPPDANGSYFCNQSVSLKAIPATTFSGWTGDILGFANPVTLKMDDDKVVVANFGIEIDLLEAYLPAVMRN